METDLNKLIKLILTKQMPAERSLLVGISGIDAGGKGFITAKLAAELQTQGFKVAKINVDGWLNLPDIRFCQNNPADNFYQNGLRLGEMFEKLILPLQKNRSIYLLADFAEETASEFRKHEYFYENIDLILLEGIFLFKKSFIDIFDLKIWIDCSFETALKRAILRSQENLWPEKTIKAYQTIYFPSQQIHFTQDDPQSLADLIYNNDY